MSERICIVTIDFNRRNDWLPEDIADELKELVSSCGGRPAHSLICRCPKPTPDLLLGSGKVKEIKECCVEHNIDTVIFSVDLKGNQQRNLEEILGVKTIDRTQLILDIFAKRAKSQEGRVQVELAQLQYLRPRLVGKGVELSRLGGGIGTLGPGETKLETDRRRIETRIAKLKKELKEISQNRHLRRKKRIKKQIPTVALVGYTNAGKSTLLNTLTESKQMTRNGLFTTLDPITRQLTLSNHQTIVLSDTVGFMVNLPHHLIEAFKATLEEVIEADLLLHVLDVSHPKFRLLHDAVIQVLRDLDASDKTMLTVFNKIDLLQDRKWLCDLEKNYDHAVAVSALKKENIDQCNEKISSLLRKTMIEIDVTLPLHRMDLVHRLHQEGEIHLIEYKADSIHICAVVPIHIAHQYNA